MARKSLRLAASPASKGQHKRAASNSTPLSKDTTRSKKQKATPTKSQYFKKNDHAFDATEDEVLDDEVSSSVEGEGSAFESDGHSSGSEGVDDDEEYNSEIEDAPRKPSVKKFNASPISKSSPAIRTKENELLKPGVKAGLGPGTEIRIKKPKARPAGKTPYRDDTIHSNTMLFLEDLKANNERQWLKMNDAEFRQAERDWASFVTALTERLIEIDDTIPELPVKDVVFRIYRDVRFSPDKTPYKPHFSAAWSRTGRKGPYAAYYVQVAPNGGSFVGGGLWHPGAAPIAAMRNEIDRNPRGLKDVLMHDQLRKEFLDSPKSEAKAVKAFAAGNAENALKTKPKGWDPEHPDIELLRLRNYTIGRKVAENEVVGPNSLRRVSELLSAMKPFVNYLNSIVMPDDQSEEEEEDDDDDDGDDEDE